MANFKPSSKGIADLQNRLIKQLGKAAGEASRAAERESTPAAKAKVFAKVLRKHGVKDVDESALRKKFGR